MSKNKSFRLFSIIFFFIHVVCLFTCIQPILEDSAFRSSFTESYAGIQDQQSSQKQSFGVKSKALLTTRFQNLDHFKSVVSVTYDKDYENLDSTECDPSVVHLSYSSNGETISRTMTSGLKQDQLLSIQKSGFSDKCGFVFANNYAVRERRGLEIVYILSRRRDDLYGSRDVAFYDLAEIASRHINTPELAYQSARDSLEKGYLNTFNHITAQAIITSFFSEGLADLIADLHERNSMPELTTGNFSQSMLKDTINNPTDNYVDIINNEIGQKIGKALKSKYGLNEESKCSPELLAAYLNDLQSYFMWAMEIGMDPFRSTDEVVIRFSDKMNSLLQNR